MTAETFELQGKHGELTGYKWECAKPEYIAVICHDYGEQMSQYEETAQGLVADNAVVYGIDLAGSSDFAKEDNTFTDLDAAVADVDLLVEKAHADYPNLSIALIGKSLGGTVAARYEQLYGDKIKVLVLANPLLHAGTDTSAAEANSAATAQPQNPDTNSKAWYASLKPKTVHAIRAGLEKLHAHGRLHKPTLWIHGTHDEMVPLNETQTGWMELRPEASEIQEAREIAGGNHDLYGGYDRKLALAETTSFVRRYL